MSPVEPVIRHMLLCDEVQREVDSPNKVNIFGLIHAIRPAEDAIFPLRDEQLAVYVELSGGRGTAQVYIARIRADSEELTFRTVERSITFGADPLAVQGLIYRIRGISFPEPGLYWVQFRYNEKVLGEQPLLVK